MSDKKIDIKNKLFKYVFDNKFMLGLSFIMSMISYYFQDVLFSTKIANMIINFTTSSLTTQSVIILLGIYLISIITSFIGDHIIISKVVDYELNMTSEITKEVISSIKNMKLDEININEYILNVQKIKELKDIYFTFVVYILPTIVMAGGILINISKNNIKMGILTILIIICFTIFGFKLEYKNIQDVQEKEQLSNELYDDIHDIINNSDNIITNNTIEKEITELNKKKDNLSKKMVSNENNLNITTSILHISNLIMIIIIDLIAIYMYKNSIISSEILINICILSITFMEYYNSMISNLTDFVKQFGKFLELQKYFEKFELDFDKKFIKENFNYINGNIRLENVSKYKLKNININIKGNSKVLFVGKNGIGKSTILKMISGLTKYNGDIFIDGQNIDGKHEELTKYIGIVGQFPKLFDNTILYNINYGVDSNEHDIWNNIISLGLFDFYNKFPDKLNTYVGKNGKELSGGQKSIIAITNILLQNKKIILLDEPTSALDTEHKKIIKNILKNIKDKTILVVSHDDYLNDIFDETIKIS